MPETITDTATGVVYDVEYEEQMASELFPWLRGTEWDAPVKVGRMIRKHDAEQNAQGPA